MRKWICLFLALLLACAPACAAGDSWVCPDDQTENTGNFCTECGLPRPVADTWTCPTCGTTGLTGGFCHECGSPRPAETAAATCEGPGYDTADDAARAYAEALNAGDINAILSTFAVETCVDYMDPHAALERVKAFSPVMFSCLPVVGPLSRGLLIERRRTEITQGIYYGWLTLATLETDFQGVSEGQMQSLADDASIDAFLSVIQDSPMDKWVGHIKVTAVCAPDDPLVSAYMPQNLNSAGVKKNLAKMLMASGAQELAERIILLDVDGATVAQCMQCIRYGHKWYNYKTQSTVALILGLSAMSNGMIVDGF